MIRSVLRHEMLIQVRDKRIILSMGVLSLILLTAVYMGWNSYINYQQSYIKFNEEIRKQWIDQGDKHPHRASHFGIYVSKPVSSLSIIEPGLAPVVGQAIWLGAHERSTYSNPPKHDDITGSIVFGSASPLLIIQMLGGLLALVMGAFCIVREKETGILRQVLAQGGNLTHLVLGKYLGLLSLLFLSFLPVALISIALILIEGNHLSIMDSLTRLAGLVIANILFVSVLLAIGLLISVRSAHSRTAFISVLSVWIIVFIIAPRATSIVAEKLIPPTSWQEFEASLSEKFFSGFEQNAGYNEQLAELKKETLKTYKVNSISELPVGFSGIRMLHMDAWSNQVGDHEYNKLKEEWNARDNIRLASAVLFPSLAVQTFSQAMAGSDWPHYQDFSEKAEDYRRGIGVYLNHTIKDELAGDVWEMDSGASVWEKTPEFAYQIPSAQWAFKQQQVSFMILVFWFIFSLCALALATKRLKP